jgi:hypothetical protein
MSAYVLIFIIYISFLCKKSNLFLGKNRALICKIKEYMNVLTNLCKFFAEKYGFLVLK